ncbi:Josephin-like protein [Cardamine amara subsp. amara]|uniref:Josephin-like protein n=1 Tax=Cardamine amara subsp. amara TaxID=228776 RepID=A0ABD1A617_CARAN
MSATGTKRSNTNTRPVQRNATVKQTTIKAPYGKNPGCTTSCGLRLPRKTEVTAARLIKHLGCKFAKGLRLVVMRKKKRAPPSKVCASSSSGRSQPSIIPIINDSHRSEAIEDCIQFINSSSSFTRSNSTLIFSIPIFPNPFVFGRSLSICLFVRVASNECINLCVTYAVVFYAVKTLYFM